MKRRAIHIESSLHDTIRIYIDQENAASILQYVFRKTVDEEFREIRELVKNLIEIKRSTAKSLYLIKPKMYLKCALPGIKEMTGFTVQKKL